jgi:glycerophosphoryl diester phosphodiesterase
MTPIPTTVVVLRQGWQDFRFAWKAASVFLLFFAILDWALLSPLIAWGLEMIVRSAGAVAITNADLMEFVLSLPGIAFLLAVGTINLALLRIQVGGLTLLAGEVAAGLRPHFWDVVSRNIRLMPRFLILSLLQTAVMLAIVAALAGLVAGIYAGLLGGHDINYYLSEQPREWWNAILLAGGLGAVFAVGLLWLIARWLFAVPLLVLGNLRPLEALGITWRATRGEALGLVRVFGAWWAGIAILSAAVSALGWLLAKLVFDWAGYLPGRVLAVVAVVMVTAFTTGTAMGVLSLGVHQFVVTRMSLPHLPRKPERPADPTIPSRARRPAMAPALAALLVILAISAVADWFELAHRNIVESVAVTAHRGSSARAPENTMSAVQQAIADGADFAEIDVQTTADGEVVLFHDGDLMRMAGDSRRLRDLTLAQAKEVDVGKKFNGKFVGERIPTLAEVIDVARGKIRLNIELKYNWPDPNLAAKVVELVCREAFLTNCIITSLDAAALAEVQRLAPEVKVGQIVTASVGDVTRLPGQILCVNKRAANRRFIQRARSAGKEVHVWTLNQASDMLLMIERGAHNLITDHPNVAIRLLRERAELSDAEKLALSLRILFGKEKTGSGHANDPSLESL